MITMDDQNLEENASEECRLQQTPIKQMYTSPSIHAANVTHSKHRRLQGSPLNATTRNLL